MSKIVFLCVSFPPECDAHNLLLGIHDKFCICDMNVTLLDLLYNCLFEFYNWIFSVCLCVFLCFFNDASE